MASPFGDDDTYVGYDPRLPSQRYESFTSFAADEDSGDHVAASDDHPTSGFHAVSGGPFGSDENVAVHHLVSGHRSIPTSPEGFGYSPDPLADFSSEPSPFSMQEPNGKAYGEEENEGFFASDGPVLPPPSEMHPEEGFILREWRRVMEFTSSSSSATFPVGHKKTSLEIKGNKTDVIVCRYDDYFMVMVTQIGCLGTILHARKEEGVSIDPTFSVCVIFGKRDEPLLVACGRQLIEHISSCGSSRPLILTLGLKDHSSATLKEILSSVIENRLW